jgi:hypothetical protein
MTLDRRAVLAIVAAVAAVALVVVATMAPREAAAGWLIGFLYVSAVPLGSLGWLLIHRLTGGRWGESLRPVFAPATTCIPLFALLFVPVLAALPLLYPWAAGVSGAKPDVAHLYLNGALFTVRAAVAFIGWSALALALLLTAGGGRLLPAFGLIFYAVTVSFSGLDWILSADPVFISTSFGAGLAVTQLLAALAFAALFAPSDLSVGARRDLGGLMLAVALGLTYIDFMAVLVIWYGDLPAKVSWFVERTAAPWQWLALGAFILGSLLPVLLLLLARVRASRAALRLVAASMLVGLALYDAYLLAPVYGAWALATAALAIIALGCGLIACVEANWPAASFNPSRAAHG